MKKLINKLSETSTGKTDSYSLLNELDNLTNKNIFWYPSAWKDMQYVNKYNPDFTKKNNLPGIGLFLHSDYRYYYDLFSEINIPYCNKEQKFIIEKFEGYYLLNDEERSEYNNKFSRNYNSEIMCSLIDEPDMWLSKIKVEGIDKHIFVIFTQLENNFLLYNVIKPYNLPVKYICTYCDGKDEGGNRTSFLEKPYSIKFQRYIRDNDVIWIEGERF